MNPRKAKVFRIQTDKENHIIKVDLTYSKGGMNFFDYKHYPEGIYLHVQPVEVERSVGCTMEKYGMGTGIKQFIEAGTRFSAKRLRDLTTQAQQNKGENITNFREILRTICQRDGFNFDTLEFDNK